MPKPDQPRPTGQLIATASTADKTKASKSARRNFATMDWEQGSSDNEHATKTTNLVEFAGFIPEHKIHDYCVGKLNLEPGVNLKWYVNGRMEYSNIFALSEVNNFGKIKVITAEERPNILDGLDENIASIHIDKFDILFTDSHERRIGSDRSPTLRIYDRTYDEYSPGAFNALMLAVIARISYLHNYCVCGDLENCDEAADCPEIKLYISTLNQDGRKIVQKRKEDGALRVIPEKTIVVNSELLGLPTPEKSQDSQQKADPSLSINISCLRRILNQERNRSGRISGAESDDKAGEAGVWGNGDNIADNSDDETRPLRSQSRDSSQADNIDDHSTNPPVKMEMPAIIVISDAESDDSIIKVLRAFRRGGNRNRQAK